MLPPIPMQGEIALVDTACAVWRSSPQRASMAVDRIMTLRLASAEAIIHWVFASAGVKSNADESLSGTAWEVLYNAINKTIARVQVRAGLTIGCQGISVLDVGLLVSPVRWAWLVHPHQADDIAMLPVCVHRDAGCPGRCAGRAGADIRGAGHS